MRQIAELFTNCRIRIKAELIGRKLTKKYNVNEIRYFEFNSPKYKRLLRNMIRINRLMYGKRPFQRSKEKVGNITETDFILTSFGNIKGDINEIPE
jgi:hypothetical protein